MSRAQRIRAAVTVISLAAVGLASGCSGKSPVSLTSGSGAPYSAAPTLSGAPSAPPSSSPAPAPDPGAAAPLTGAAVGAGNGERVVVVPILIRDGGRGPAGVGSADIVAVDYAEQGTIRLAAAFQSQNSDEVGPVTQLRPSETHLFAQTGAAIAESGTPSGFLDVAKSSGLSYVGTSTSGVYTDHTGQPYADTKALRAKAAKHAVTGPMFEYAGAGEPLSGSGISTISTVSITVSGHSTMTWHYTPTAKAWHTVINGTTVTTTNLVILTTGYTQKSVHALKRTVSFADPGGSGAARVIAGPQTVSAKWFKKNLGAALNMLGPDQAVPQLWPGRTWIYMIPAGSSVRVS
jgi:hypothetical protein